MRVILNALLPALLFAMVIAVTVTQARAADYRTVGSVELDAARRADSIGGLKLKGRPASRADWVALNPQPLPPKYRHYR